jgi:hypothetical protein
MTSFTVLLTLPWLLGAIFWVIRPEGSRVTICPDTEAHLPIWQNCFARQKTMSSHVAPLGALLTIPTVILLAKPSCNVDQYPVEWGAMPDWQTHSISSAGALCLTGCPKACQLACQAALGPFGNALTGPASPDGSVEGLHTVLEEGEVAETLVSKHTGTNSIASLHLLAAYTFTILITCLAWPLCAIMQVNPYKLLEHKELKTSALPEDTMVLCS